MDRELLNALMARMRRAAFVLLPAGLLIGLGSLLALRLGYASVDRAGSFLALSFVLLICGVVLFAISLAGRRRRGH